MIVREAYQDVRHVLCRQHYAHPPAGFAPLGPVESARAGGPCEACTDAHCRHCGWLVSAEGVTIDVDCDLPRDGARPERCSDTACESAAVCDVLGREVYRAVRQGARS